MTHTDLISQLIRKKDYATFLEIGVRNPSKNINKIPLPASQKVGVDPFNWKTQTMEDASGKFIWGQDGYECQFYNMKSEYFFEINHDTFDIIFVDGNHEASDVLWDCINCMDRLNENGTLLVHDLNPPSENSQKIPRQEKVWTGNGWKAWNVLINYLSERGYAFKYNVILEDFGIGVVELMLPGEELVTDYNTFQQNKIAYWGVSPCHTISQFLANM